MRARNGVAERGPLFGAIHRSSFEAVGIRIDAERRGLMAPEALLSRLADRGVDTDGQERLMLAGGEPKPSTTRLLPRWGTGRRVGDELRRSHRARLDASEQQVQPSSLPCDEPSWVKSVEVV